MMSEDRVNELLVKLGPRLPALSEKSIVCLIGMMDMYSLQVSVRNIKGVDLVRFTDEKNQSVNFCEGELRGDSLYIRQPPTKLANSVVVVASSGMLVGWEFSTKLQNLGDRCMVNRKALNPMPSSFLFNQACAHMQKYGGVMTGDEWECFGCSKLLVGNGKT